MTQVPVFNLSLKLMNLKWGKQLSGKEREKKTSEPNHFHIYSSHELLSEPKSEKYLSNSSTRDSHVVNEVFHRNLKAQ